VKIWTPHDPDPHAHKLVPAQVPAPRGAGMSHLTIYADLDSWLVKLAQGWRLCGHAPAPRVPFWVMMWRPA